jgi:hypothetical protein
MTKQELNELKKLAKFLWRKAALLERDSDDRLKVSDLPGWSITRAKAEIYKHTSTLLSMKLERLQRCGKKQQCSTREFSRNLHFLKTF